MASLIIALISIVLVVALVAATMYSGGSGITDSQKEAKAAQSVSEIEQVQAAHSAYKANVGDKAPSMQALVDTKYLSHIPAEWDAALPNMTTFSAKRVVVGSEADQLDLCTRINKKLNFADPTPPVCSSVDVEFVGCCQTN